MRIRTGQYLVLLASMALTGPASAACLLNDYSIQAEYDRGVAVVMGRVVAERSVVDSVHHYNGVIYTVSVEEVYRGERRQLLEVFSENSSGRFPMQPQERYLLFIHQNTGRLAVDNCGNSGPVSQRTAVIRAVEALVSPRRGGQTPNSPLERPGMNAQAEVTPASAGRSAPSR